MEARDFLRHKKRGPVVRILYGRGLMAIEKWFIGQPCGDDAETLSFYPKAQITVGIAYVQEEGASLH